MKQVWVYKILGLLFFFGGALCMSFIQNLKLTEVGTIFILVGYWAGDRRRFHGSFRPI